MNSLNVPIFSESLYSRLLCDGERIRINQEGTFEILPPESLSNRLKRFMTFQQDPYIDAVHNRFQSLVDQIERREGADYDHLKNEIHENGKVKFRYLQENLITLRAKLNRVGKTNLLSKLILKVINKVRTHFGGSPIEIKNYTVTRNRNNLQYSAPSFHFQWTSGSYSNPFEEEGLRLTDVDKKRCRFAAEDPNQSELIQKLERGLEDYYLLGRERNIFLQHNQTLIVNANLEISFDAQTSCFVASINNAKTRILYNPVNTSSNPNIISEGFAQLLHELSPEEKTICFKVNVTDIEGNEEQFALTWEIGTTDEGPYCLNKGSSHFVLEPDYNYEFCKQDGTVLSSLKIIRNEACTEEETS